MALDTFDVIGSKCCVFCELAVAKESLLTNRGSKFY